MSNEREDGIDVHTLRKNTECHDEQDPPTHFGSTRRKNRECSAESARDPSGSIVFSVEGFRIRFHDVNREYLLRINMVARTVNHMVLLPEEK